MCWFRKKNKEKVAEIEEVMIKGYVIEVQLSKIYPNSTLENRAKFLPYLNEYFEKYGINTYDRICAFLAQIGHESAELRYVEEIASGSAYEGRKDLGNTEPGDGVKYKGRGLIQITGRANYTELSNDFEVDFVNEPTLLQSDRYAVASAFWYWDKRSLNRYADNGDFVTLTKRINGGTNGLKDRQRLWENAKRVLKE